MKPHPHTLLATTGASPQGITETLYAIHHSNAQWPDALFLITTSFGKRKAVQGLLEEGHLQRLCTQLQRPLPAFDASHVLVAPGADGQPVEDARSVADHEALANFIMTVVRDRTQASQGSRSFTARGCVAARACPAAPRWVRRGRGGGLLRPWMRSSSAANGNGTTPPGRHPASSSRLIRCSRCNWSGP